MAYLVLALVFFAAAGASVLVEMHHTKSRLSHLKKPMHIWNYSELNRHESMASIARFFGFVFLAFGFMAMFEAWGG